MAKKGLSVKLPGAFLLCVLFVVPMVNAGAAQSTVTCDQFTSQVVAQIYLNDQNAKQLDPDGDGRACNARLPSVLLPAAALDGDTQEKASPGAARSTVSCDQFTGQATAQIALNDQNAKQLDPDGDGTACEDLSTPVSISFTILTPTPTSDTQEKSSSSSSDDQGTTQEERYFSALLQDLIALDDASRKVAELFIDAGQDASLLQDPEWLRRTDVQFDRLDQVGVDAELLTPSTRQQPIHELWLEVNRLVTLAVEDFREGIDTRDASTITTGSARYTYSSLLANDLGEAIKAFGDNPGQPIEPEHVVAPVTECDVFSDYDEAQLYYAANPEEQETIDPDFDGLACEVFFERE